MKKFSVVLILLALSLAFASCYTTGSVDEPTPFEGRWVNLSAINEQGYDENSLTFTGNTFVYRYVLNANIIIEQTVTGTFKFSKSRIQFKTRTHKATQRYTLTGVELNLGRSGGAPFTSGVYTRQ